MSNIKLRVKSLVAWITRWGRGPMDVVARDGGGVDPLDLVAHGC